MISISLDQLIKVAIESPVWPFVAITFSIIIYILFQGINSPFDVGALVFSLIFTICKIVDAYHASKKAEKLGKTFHLTLNPENCIWARGTQGEKPIVTLRADCKIKNCTNAPIHLTMVGITCKEEIIHRDIVPKQIPANETIDGLIVLALDKQLTVGKLFKTKLFLADSNGKTQSYPIIFKSI